jgi:DNA-binding MarR family transcriptional regulator
VTRSDDIEVMLGGVAGAPMMSCHTMVKLLDCIGACLYSGAVADETEWNAEVTLPALLRAARKAYGAAIRSALADAGCDDVPSNGSYVIGAIARTGAPLSDIIQWLGVSKQAAGQLVDTLVTRGFLGRSVDPEDRRRLTITLTERGVAVAAVIRSAVDGVDAALAAEVGPDYVAHTRATLASLAAAAQHA